MSERAPEHPRVCKCICVSSVYVYVSLCTWKLIVLVCVCECECVCAWVSLGISKTNRHLRGEKRGRGQREEVRRYVNEFREQWMTGHARSWGGGRGEGG